jgi:hypothetical protein
VRLPNWRPELPDVEIRRVYLHWTAGDYHTVFPAYHFCVALDAAGEPVVCATNDLRANARELSAGDDPPEYAAHVAGRNSFACGIAVAAMAGATPQHFGAFPLRDDLVDALCRVTALVCARYSIAIAPGSVATHAEAALEDGYFGAGEDERWDIARLKGDARPLVPADALATAEELRARIRRMG